MEYRGQEKKEFFPKHLIVTGLRLIEDDRHSEYLLTEDINTVLEIFIESWSLLKVNGMCYGNEFGGAFEA